MNASSAHNGPGRCLTYFLVTRLPVAATAKILVVDESTVRADMRENPAPNAEKSRISKAELRAQREAELAAKQTALIGAGAFRIFFSLLQAQCEQQTPLR